MDYTEANFYMLPKIHKKGVPGRPICSSVNHPTSRISKLVDEHIKEYVPKTKSYIRDTKDFIKNIKNPKQYLSVGGSKKSGCYFRLRQLL